MEATLPDVPRPNVIVITLDTLRRDAVACYGQRPPWGEDFPAIQTPHLDRFAADAVRFDRAFPEVLPTLPARRALYTGQRVYPFRNGDIRLKGDFVAAPGWGPIPEEQWTLAEIFAAEGYRTGLISDLYHEFKPSKNFWRGFDQWTFIRGQEADPARSGPYPPAEFVRRYMPPELLELRRGSDKAAGVKRAKGPDWAADFARNFYGRRTESDWTSVKVFTGAIEWLEQNQDARDSGVFLTVESFDPHEPWFVPANYRRMYDDTDGQDNVLSPYAEVDLPPALLKRTRANYAGAVTMVDHWFGALYEALAAGGWLDNSVIAVLADHGHSLADRGYMGKRGYPGVPEVVAVPMMVRFPGGAHGGRVEPGWIQHHDLAATLLDVAGVTPPEPIDGRSVAATVAGQAGPVRDHVVIGWGANVVVATDDWWLSVKANGRGALLYPREKATDPAEPSVAEQHPDVVEELFGLALKEAGGAFPDYIVGQADNQADAPGCSPVVASPVAR
jgi:arylsulfatase A-like enzyme